MIEPKKAQHYVPQFYLSIFAVDPSVVSKNRRIHVYDKIIRTRTVRKIAAVGFETYFNNIPASILPPEFAEDIQGPEDILSKVEGVHSQILRDSLDRIHRGISWLPSPETKVYLGAVMALMFIRTTTYRRAIREGLATAPRNLILAHVERDLVPHIEGPLPDYEELLDSLAKLQHQVHMHNPAGSGGQIEVLTSFLADDFIWVLGRNDSDYSFYASDNPVQYVCFQNEADTVPGVDYATMNAPGTIVSMPISPKYTIFLYAVNGFKDNGVEDGEIIGLSREEVEFWNEAQVRGSERMIFCQSDQFEFTDSALQRHPEYRDVGGERARRYKTTYANIVAELQANIEP